MCSIIIIGIRGQYVCLVCSMFVQRAVFDRLGSLGTAGDGRRERFARYGGRALASLDAQS